MGVSDTQIAPGRALSPQGGHDQEASRRFAMVGFQQSTQTLNADDFTLVPLMLGLDDLVEPLVNPVMMIVQEILREDVSQLVFRGEDQVAETLLFDGSHEALRMGIQIGTAWG